MNHIEINFINFNFKKFPKVKIYIDGDLLEEVHFHKHNQQVRIPTELNYGKHTLEIEHFDKTSKDTQIINGKISADTKFTIKSINIDDFDIPTSLLYLSEFKPNWKNLVKPKNFPDVLRQSFTIGPNGTWKFKFETPIEDWLIKDRKEKNEKIKNIKTYESYEVSTESVIDHILTEKDIKLIKEIKQLLHE